MSTLEYYYYSIAILFLYLVLILLKKEYRLVLPSTSFCTMWLITCVLVVFQINGILVENTFSVQKFALVAPFTFYVSLASVFGFSTAHLLSNSEYHQNYSNNVDIELLEYYLIRFRWVPYLCGITGFTLLVFLITSIGSVENFSDYRIMAIYTKRVGYAAIAQRISGHINILGLFYLMIYGYVCGQKGIILKQFLWMVFLCSLINISIGGRVWILTSLLPFFTTYILSIKDNNSDTDIKSSTRKLFIILMVFISLFAIMGIARGDGDGQRFMDKFLYLTDGSRMTNLMLGYYPEGTFEHEYGSSTLLNGFIPSPMVQKFADRISDHIGLSVTVKSILPNLYYDYGIYGGALFMGFLCCILELVCLYFRYSSSVFDLICYGTLAGLLVQSPVGNVFTLYTPIFEWLIIIFIFRKWIFNKGMNNTEFEL